MTTYKEYYQVLDELRLSRNMTVSKLCEDIISERTYYRNLQSDEEIKFNTFTKLLDRLGIELAQFVHYAMYFRSGDPSVGKFVFRVFAHHFQDIGPIYQTVLKFQADNRAFAMAVEAFIKKYEYLIGIISKEEYIQVLEVLIKTTNKDSLKNIYIITLYTLYIEMVKDKGIINVREVAEQIITIDFRLNALFYVIVLNYIIYSVIGTDIIDEKLFRDLVKRMKDVLQFFGIKVFLITGALYTAYIHYLDGNEELKNKYLLKYITNLNIIAGGEAYIFSRDKVEQLFNIDFDSFVVEQSEKEIKSNQFNIIKKTPLS